MLYLLVAGLALTYAQEPKRCISPATWEARVLRVDPSKAFDSLGKFSYDAPNMRTRFIEEVDESQERSFYDELFLFKEKIGYRFNIREKTCVRFNLTEPFRAIEVPPEARSFGSLYIGSSAAEGAGVLVDVWGGQTERGRYSGSWTSVGCIPVNDAYVSTQTGVAIASFFDVTGGISDPNIFIPPAECQQRA